MKLASAKRPFLKIVYELFFCLILLVNCLLALFDLTYLSGIPYSHLTFRDVYLEYFPGVTVVYDPIKGIEPHRFTEKFLKEAAQAQSQIESDGLSSPGAQELLARLSADMRSFINSSPFSIAAKDGTFERIKNKMRRHMGLDSAKESFARFFSADNFSGDRMQAEWRFFAKEIAPLIRQNYYRHLGEDGEYEDRFYRYDLFFVIFFAIDFLARWIFALATGNLRRWYLFPVRRWYDLFLLVPPHHAAWLRLGRLIALYVRLKDNRFLPGEGIVPDIIHDNAAVIAEEISGLVLLNILEQAQNVLRTRSLADIAVDDVDLKHLDDLVDSQLEIMAQSVVPELQPEIADLVRFSIDKALEPWLLSPTGIVFRLALVGVHKGVRDGLEAALSSKEGSQRLSSILKKSSTVLLAEASESGNLKVLQEHLVRVIEGVKRQVTASIQKK